MMINCDVKVTSSLLTSDTNFEQQTLDGITPTCFFCVNKTTHLLVGSTFTELTGTARANNHSRGLNKLSVTVAIVHMHQHVHGENCI